MAKLSVYQQTVDKLQAKILSGEWQPGQRLPTMKQLSKQMGVRSPQVNGKSKCD